MGGPPRRPLPVPEPHGYSACGSSDEDLYSEDSGETSLETEHDLVGANACSGAKSCPESSTISQLV